jgi:cysteine desulfurase
MIGGGQERGRRSGTENVPYIVGLGMAAQLAKTHLDAPHARVPALRDRLERELVSRIPGAVVNGSQEHRLPNTTNLAFPGLRASALVAALSEVNICVSPGAACHAGEDRPSPVLQAMGIAREVAVGAIRISLSRYTTESEVATAVDLIAQTVQRLRATQQATDATS